MLSRVLIFRPDEKIAREAGLKSFPDARESKKIKGEGKEIRPPPLRWPVPFAVCRGSCSRFRAQYPYRNARARNPGAVATLRWNAEIGAHPLVIRFATYRDNSLILWWAGVGNARTHYRGTQVAFIRRTVNGISSPRKKHFYFYFGKG
jgi:hypothetical protein